jgi:RNA polymerase sigma-70 factor (ECF subfamily)
MQNVDYHLLTDAELVQLYRKHAERSAMEELYRRYHKKAFGVAYSVFRNKDESTDVMLAVFEKMLREMANTEIREFAAWIYVLTRNECLMRLRSDKRRVAREKLFAMSQPLDESYEPEFFHEKNNALKQALAALSDTQRMCLELFYFEQKSYKEVADELGLDTEAVRSQLQNGKRNLKNLMASWR